MTGSRGTCSGEDPIGSALTAARAAIASVADAAAPGGTVQLSFGETPKEEYAMQLAADNLIHGWDLAVATGGDTRMDPNLVHAIADWFDDREELYRGGGAISARRPLTGDAQHDLLARFGRDARGAPTTGRSRGSTPPSAPATSTPRSRWSRTTSSSSRPRPPPTDSVTRAATRSARPGPRCWALPA